MKFCKLHFNSIFIGVTLLTLVACSGMSPGGGGAPGEVGGGGSLDGGSLGGGSGVGGGGAGGGGPLGGGPLGDAGGGEAQPSTQQSGDNIGGGCARFYQVKLKVLHNGSEEACTVATAVTYRVNTDLITNGGGYNAPPEVDGDPKVTLNIGYPITQTLACIGGQWQTAEPIFIRAVCNSYDVTVYATWQRQGKGHVSNTFQGAPVPNENNDPIPIDLTIDLGQDSLHVPLEDMENAPVVY